MNDRFVWKARDIADRMPLNMNRMNVDRLRAVFTYDLAKLLEDTFEEGLAAGRAEMTPPGLRNGILRVEVTGNPPPPPPPAPPRGRS